MALHTTLAAAALATVVEAWRERARVALPVKAVVAAPAIVLESGKEQMVRDLLQREESHGGALALVTVLDSAPVVLQRGFAVVAAAE